MTAPTHEVSEARAHSNGSTLNHDLCRDRLISMRKATDGVRRTVAVAVLVAVVLGIHACSDDEASEADGTDMASTADDASTQGDPPDAPDGGTPPMGTMDAAVPMVDASIPVEEIPDLPTGLGVSAGGGVGISANYKLRLGVGAPAGIHLGSGQRYQVKVGNPTLTRGY